MNCCVRCVLLVFFAGIVNAAPLDTPTTDTVNEARRLVSEMIMDSRGPYSRIRWYCNDGTTQAPVAYACREHGGGRQHAEYSDKQRRLAELGWFVGTIYAPLSIDDLLNSEPRQHRLRELPLEQYLTDIDNGWVLRNARAYRGRVQIEDEEAAGRALLLRLLADPGWVDTNFLLIRELMRTIPHGEDTDIARAVRRTAIELAELDSAAERWRAEIHGKPNADTAARLRKWLQGRRAEVVLLGEKLAQDLDTLYGASGRRERIENSLSRLTGPAVDWQRQVRVEMQQRPMDRVVRLCTSLAVARSTLFRSLTADARLTLFDAMQGIETDVQLSFQEMVAGTPMSRRETLRLSKALVECSFGSGLLSVSEVQALTWQLPDRDNKSLSLQQYRMLVGRLKRAPAWAVGTIRHAFADPLIRYTALDARAVRFSDDLLRSSPMWMLGDTLRVLSKDLDTLSGSIVELNGRPAVSAVALNGGVARGVLRIFETIDEVEAATLNPTDVVVLPETLAELSPVAGILTLGEGNALSHVQLLARNFGIPNVAVDQSTVDALRAIENKPVVLVVDNNGNVILQEQDEALRAYFAAAAATAADIAQIVVPMPRLGVKRILPLQQIGRELSGKLIGPKAANLGELNRLFPGRVAPAVAIPFGIYAEHLDQAQLIERIRSVFDNHAKGDISKEQFDAELADVRKRIASIELSDTTRRDLVSAMQDAFGEPGTYGIFVRSDTNVEDLPQFTGAGLNETIPNVVGLDAQLRAVPRVWSSVFSPRALAWRSSVLANPDQIYASVLLMKSVPATKSGVLVTSNLFDKSYAGLTVSAAWGVGGAVAGEPAESIVIKAKGVEVYSEAKSPYQREISSGGGVRLVAAPAGRVLLPAELNVLRGLAAEVNEKYAPVYDDSGAQRPWDIEFGFVDGELTLFQIRPLVERGNRNADVVINFLRPLKSDAPSDPPAVQLDESPGL